ncbi:MAG TPA: type IV toxin-antitoxin system AbiEi family antitoxin domain-containing protein [Phycisphaerae bacterium]|nr:type IV toxin-antitoxin system AbiEi family antitoxin domain-containing protein [Phycisphaerae bacterium]
MARTDRDKVLDIIRRTGMVRLRDLRERGLHPEHLRRLAADGLILRVARGVYVPADAEPTGNHSLAQAAKQAPHGVICLLSSLRFHEVGTQNPFQVWMAVDRRARKPQVRSPRLRVVRFSGAALTEGIEVHNIEGVSVRIYNVAKTVADCFKYRNKLGLDVAIEALREGIRGRHFTRDELWQYAKTCRVTNVIRPYLEATV